MTHTKQMLEIRQHGEASTATPYQCPHCHTTAPPQIKKIRHDAAEIAMFFAGAFLAIASCGMLLGEQSALPPFLALSGAFVFLWNVGRLKSICPVCFRVVGDSKNANL